MRELDFVCFIINIFGGGDVLQCMGRQPAIKENFSADHECMENPFSEMKKSKQNQSKKLKQDQVTLESSIEHTLA